MTWVLPVIGAWTFIAPWAIRGGDFNTTAAVANNVTLGTICFVLGLASVFIAIRRPGR
jgi:SPW repeat-containing protein